MKIMRKCPNVKCSGFQTPFQIRTKKSGFRMFHFSCLDHFNSYLVVGHAILFILVQGEQLQSYQIKNKNFRCIWRILYPNAVIFQNLNFLLSNFWSDFLETDIFKTIFKPCVGLLSRSFDMAAISDHQNHHLNHQVFFCVKKI
jgi:hypothetical protein